MNSIQVLDLQNAQLLQQANWSHWSAESNENIPFQVTTGKPCWNAAALVRFEEEVAMPRHGRS